ncbi:hypothetical protein ACFWP2_37375 [Kitasatospora sp. NPDC058444]|uniref:hypothetical protein n=1 Tax=Kitasatospora sp. NPDC058444 TaxID=3346504 RepID=UPI00365667E8
MNGRVLRTELKRSAAPWAGAAVLGGSLAVFFLIDGIWWRGTAGWTAQWTTMALWTRSLLAFWLPLVVGIGAVYGLREPRSRMTELLATTPLPAWRRAALPTGALALALAAGFGLLVLTGGVRVALGPTTYTGLGWLPIPLVAVLGLVAAGVFAMGVARTLPSVLTPPALVVACLVMTNMLRARIEGEVPTTRTSNRLGLLSPVTADPRQMLLTLSGSVHLGQTIWLLGLLATGLVLLAAATRRARLLAVAPALAGAAAALLILPAAARDSYVVDKAAAAMVCDGPVCVTQASRSHLAELAPRGREALSVLHDVLGDGAPTSVREDTALRALGDPRSLPADAVPVDFDDQLFIDATGKDLTRALVAQGLAPSCHPRTSREGGGQDDVALQSIAVSWALGEPALRPMEEKATDEYSRRTWAAAEAAWQGLKGLAPAEQRARIAELRTAALSCTARLRELPAGGAAR